MNDCTKSPARTVGASAQEFSTQGFHCLRTKLAANECEAVLREVLGMTTDAAGTRKLMRMVWCRRLVADLRQNAEIDAIIPPDYVAVQCTYFEKSQDRNWLVPIHQDLSIPVAARVEHAELSGWSEKEGELFVQPPVSVLERMVALRLHIDPCGVEDGALSVVPGSHALGRLSTEAAIALRAERGPVVCPVSQGGVFAMRPLLLHSSSRATGNSRRRVLHFLFGPPQLPCGLRWRFSA